LQDNQDFSLLSKVIPAKFLPDKMRIIQNPVPLIEAFIGDLVNLLHVGDIQIRDIVRDAFGYELSPRLYGRLIRNMEEYVLLLFVFDTLVSHRIIVLFSSSKMRPN
jgi:hypothetical protein